MAHTNLDMDVLRNFVSGVRLGSFVKAAEHAGRSQSALSLQLRKLEQQTGQVLFRKSGRGLLLTETGETFYQYAVRLLELNDEALTAMSHHNIAGVIRIGIPPDFAETWLPDILGRFSRAHRDILIEARVDRKDILLEALADGALDLTLYWSDGAPKGSVEASNLVGQYQAVWVGLANFDYHQHDTLPLVMMNDPCVFRRRGIESLDKQDAPWRMSFLSHSLSGLWAAVNAGLGVTVRTPAGLPASLQVLDHDAHALPALDKVYLHLQSCESPSSHVRHFIATLKENILEKLQGA